MKVMIRNNHWPKSQKVSTRIRKLKKRRRKRRKRIVKLR